MTDPPYNVDYEGGAGKIENDHMAHDAFTAFLENAFNNASQALKPGGAWYIFHADSNGLQFREAAEKALGELRQVLIWAKNSFVLGRQDYQWQHEPCLYGWKDGAAHYFAESREEATVWEDWPNINKLTASEAKRMLKEILNGDNPVTVIREPKPVQSKEHPTMKPVRLVGKLIRNSTREGEVVLDVFGGSGTTLMAAEQLGRKAYLMEYDPRFVDVIVRRWEQFTGKKAEKQNTKK